VELCTSCWEALILMGVTIMLSMRIEIKKIRPILSLERRPWCGIKDWSILEKNGLLTLRSKGMVEGMSNCTLDFDLCEHFMYGKKN
jgi:hypothetical protein